MITPGLPQGSALSPMLYNIYTVGVTTNQLEAPSRAMNFADVILVYRHGRDREGIARSVQAELNRYRGLKINMALINTTAQNNPEY